MVDRLQGCDFSFYKAKTKYAVNNTTVMHQSVLEPNKKTTNVLHRHDLYSARTNEKNS